MKQLVVRFAYAASALVLLTSCETNPITGRSQLALVSEQQIIGQSTLAYTQTVTQARTKGKLNQDAALLKRVQTITDNLVKQAIRYRPETQSWQWQVNVIESPSVNAWCMAGGKMAIYTGIIEKLKLTDDEIAQVMGHEISHALLSHSREKVSRARATDVGLLLGSIVARTDLTGFSSIAEMAVLLPNSREAENEADTVGIELAAKAGYNPNAAVTIWQKMTRLGGGQPPQFLSTHPSHEERITNLVALVPRMMPIYEAAKKRG